MKRPSSEHLTYKFEAYEGCTIGELVACAVISYLVFVLVIALIIPLGFNRYLGFGLMLIGIYLVPKKAIKRLSTFKKGKPHGYFIKVVRLKLKHSIVAGLARRIALLDAPYVTRCGAWSTVRQKEKNTHV